MKLKDQIMLEFGALILISITVSGILYQSINRSFAEKEIISLSRQTLYATQNNVHSVLNNANRYSQRIIKSNTVQAYLRDAAAEQSDPQSNVDIANAINEIMLAEETVSSIYIFRNGILYFSWDNLLLGMKTDSIAGAPWYGEVTEKRGGQVWVRNSGGVLNQRGNGPEYISLIREINDLYTFKKIGILMINIPLSEITDSFERTIGENRLNLMVSRNGEPLISFSDKALNYFSLSDQFARVLSDSFKHKVGGQEYRFASADSDGWRYTIAFPMNYWDNPYEPLNRILIPLALVNFLLIFFGSIRISQSVTRPLFRLLESMKKAEDGDFSLSKFKGKAEEILLLQERYNSMIVKIEQSMVKEKEEQKVRRRLELDILHEQVKPHFLYNSLEAAGYLALSGEREKSYKLITSLASFYRQSLSKGNEFISLKQEFEVTQNFLTIEKMRYPDTFTDGGELDDRLRDCRIPKLTLQPLVENALQHGIMPTGQRGYISISAVPDGARVRLEVRDDGIGMGEEDLRKITGESLSENRGSFGLRGTIMRMRLYYGDDFEYAVDSYPGEGTAITLLFPIQSPQE